MVLTACWLGSLVGHTHKVDLYYEGTREPLKDFKQGRDAIQFAFQKDHSGGQVGEDLGVGH